ncbi:sensor histidine kinase [Colwellia psychrerythraea]|uniref:ATP-binding region ATPase domain protein n=1 Tax=Colwellia psychrerythraea TaxID=28229 RepID=A0A099KFV3_COLPS|nr:ATP-binding protein [Colwellia psychrerythraea]KGJ89150.1 ATP-binding region ATPase domain protein [Colwellia psychrerythraea]
MSENKNVLFLNHDVNNHLGIAMGSFEILLLNNPELQQNVYAERVTKGLLRARDLSHELAQTYQDSDESAQTDKNFLLISVQEHFLKNSKPAYDKLMEIYNIKINLQVTMIDEPKKAYLNPVELVRLRENIVSNAIAAGATILDVHIEMKETYLVGTFTDNGKGMSQEELDKTILFQHGDGKVHGIGTRTIVEGASKYGYSISYSSIEGKSTTIRTLVPYYEE